MEACVAATLGPLLAVGKPKEHLKCWRGASVCLYNIYASLLYLVITQFTLYVACKLDSICPRHDAIVQFS